MGLPCSSAGLNTTYKIWIAYASSSSGANFSLGTPLTTSKYRAIISLISTAGTPDVTDFIGQWVLMYGTNELIESAATSATSSTTPTDISKFTLPVNSWFTNDTINLNYTIWTAIPAGSGQLIEVFCCGQSMVALDMSLFTADALAIRISIKKTSTTSADLNFEVKYTDSSGTVLGEAAYFGSISGMDNTDSIASDIHLTATSVSGSEVLNNKFSSGQIVSS